MKPRILILSVAYSPHWGGAELAIKHITDRMAEQFDFYMLTARMDHCTPVRERIGAVEVERLGHGGFWSKYTYVQNVLQRVTLSASGASSRRVTLRQPFDKAQSDIAQHDTREQAFDLVWAVLESYAGIAGMFIKKKHPEVPYVLTLQSGDSQSFWRLRTAWWRSLYRKVYVVPDHVTAISSYLVEQAQAHGRIGSITVVPNGVDVEKFKVQSSKFKREDSDLLKRYYVAVSDKIIITTSRLVYKNGIDILIKAMRGLPEHVKLIIVGEGKLRMNLEVLTERLGLGKRVIFAGEVSHEELPQYLACADVFVRPSRSEGLGNSFLEAMAARVPVVGTPVGGIPDFLNDGETGLLCKVDSPEDVAQKIERILNDDVLRERLLENGRKLVEEKYGWDNIAQGMQNVFKSCISSF